MNCYFVWMININFFNCLLMFQFQSKQVKILTAVAWQWVVQHNTIFSYNSFIQIIHILILKNSIKICSSETSQDGLRISHISFETLISNWRNLYFLSWWPSLMEGRVIGHNFERGPPIQAWFNLFHGI
jgi:hypothetical protein